MGKWIFILFALLSGNLYAQPKFYTEVEAREIFVGQRFQVRYVVEGTREISRVTIPAYPGFSVVNIYDVPLSQKMDVNSGRLVDVFSKVVVLMAREKGDFIIKGAIADINGKIMRSANTRIVVKNGEESDDPNAVIDASEILPGEEIEDKISENFFLTGTINKRSCYVGELLLAEYKAWSRLNASSQVTRRPSFTGFSVIEMVNNYDTQPSVERMNGRNYFVHLIRKVQLVPLQPGNYTIDRAEVETVIRFLHREEDIAFEDILRGNSDLRVIEQEATLRSPSLKVEVKELPRDSQPDNFAGAVGKFSIQATVDKRVIPVNGSAILKVIIKGEGNFPLINVPDIPVSEYFDLSAPQLVEQTNPAEFPMKGQKEYSYVLSPSREGNFEVPSLAFSYFDPSIKKYQTVYTDPVLFRVEGNIPGEKFPDESLLTNGSNRGIPVYFLLMGLIVLGLVSWLLYRYFFKPGKPEAQLAEPGPVALKEDGVSPMVLIDKYYQQGDVPAFLRAVQQAIYDHLISRYGIQARGLTSNSIRQRMLNSNATVAEADRTIALLRECEISLYTPGTTVDMDGIREEAGNILG